MMTMLNKRVVGWLLMACCLAVLVGCVEPQPRASSYGTSYSSGGGSGRCQACGVVNDVQIVNVDKNVSPMGMVIGAVAGGLLGNTIGKGDGRTAATVVGAVAGGAVGNQVGKHNGNPDQAFQITIRLDDGRVATVTQADDPQVRRGDYVEVRNNRVYRR